MWFGMLLKWKRSVAIRGTLVISFFLAILIYIIGQSDMWCLWWRHWKKQNSLDFSQMFIHQWSEKKAKLTHHRVIFFPFKICPWGWAMVARATYITTCPRSELGCLVCSQPIGRNNSQEAQSNGDGVQMSKMREKNSFSTYPGMMSILALMTNCHMFELFPPMFFLPYWSLQFLGMIVWLLWENQSDARKLSDLCKLPLHLSRSSGLSLCLGEQYLFLHQNH